VYELPNSPLKVPPWPLTPLPSHPVESTDDETDIYEAFPSLSHLEHGGNEAQTIPKDPSSFADLADHPSDLMKV
jgi:hypothetical protein